MMKFSPTAFFGEMLHFGAMMEKSSGMAAALAAGMKLEKDSFNRVTNCNLEFRSTFKTKTLAAALGSGPVVLTT